MAGELEPESHFTIDISIAETHCHYCRSCAPRGRRYRTLIRMKRNLVPAVVFTISALTLAGCSNSDDNGFESAGTPTETTVEQAETNDRGAVEVALGEPVTLTDDTGTPSLLLPTLNSTRPDARPLTMPRSPTSRQRESPAKYAKSSSKPTSK